MPALKNFHSPYNMEILHFAIDDKFVPFAQRIFELVYPGRSQWRIMKLPASRVSSISDRRGVVFVGKDYWFSRRLQAEMAAADCLVIHYLNPWFSRAITCAPRQLFVMWHGWGGDYAHLISDITGGQYLPLTRQWSEQHPAGFGLHDRIQRRSRAFVDAVVYRCLFPDWFDRVCGRIDAASMLEDELDALKDRFGQLRAFHHQLYYSSLEHSFNLEPGDMVGPDILLGNSATLSNNHLDAFEFLRKLDIGDRRIVVPLSYGDQIYGDHIQRVGQSLFGSRFVPLRDFLPALEFSRVTRSCGIVIMDHLRQQANGNISIALLKGAKVFLQSSSLLSKFYKGLGATIYDIPNADTFTGGGADEIFSPLSEAQRSNNRRIVENYWSESVVINQVKRLKELVERKQQGNV